MLPMDEVYKLHSQMVYRYLLTLTGDAEAAQELTQETFYQAVKGIERFDASCKLSTWLCAIAKNQLQSYRRKNIPMAGIEEIDVSVDSAEKCALANMHRVEVLKKLHEFEEPLREVMYLRLFGDLAFREIGEVLGKTENWARVSFYRGKERLKKELEADE